MIQMKRKITLTELKKQNSYQYEKLLLALNRNRVQTSEKRKTNLEKHEIKNGYITLKLQ